MPQAHVESFEGDAIRLELNEREIAGLGMHLVKGVMSEVACSYLDGHSVIRMEYAS